jgi:hypothetical protein
LPPRKPLLPAVLFNVGRQAKSTENTIAVAIPPLWRKIGHSQRASGSPLLRCGQK